MTSVADGHFLELAVCRLQLVGLVVSLCRSAGAWLYKVWLCPLCAGLVTWLRKLYI